ncbi:helicase RepA family protein [Wolbachia endosymbiont of Atemnus politus]|uniref:helicase RepA family protein n=1 Tax=Wolbachia endosymbiont of Atemnus politus TaxID=2682840 RepID=UPI002102BC0F|nr:helicase RepA family protein [Wolbachia endosymbiont of Atemnus politus]
MPDIFASDPLRNIFNSCKYGNEKNDNSAMLFFLLRALEKLRNVINQDSGKILTHHTKKIIQKDAGRRSISRYKFCWIFKGILEYRDSDARSNDESADHQIIFEFRNGERLPSKLVDKINGYWQLVDQWNS